MAILFFLRGIQEWLIHSEHYQIKKVVIKGTRLLSTDEILCNTNLRSPADILNVNLAEVEKQIRRNPFVATVYVTRRFPAALEIEINERFPIAYVSGTELVSVDSNGVILPLPKPGIMSDLPVITGIKNFTERPGKVATNDTLLHAIKILSYAKWIDKSLYHRFSEIHSDPRHGFLLYLTDYGFPIYLGWETSFRKLQYLNALLPRLQKEKRLASLHYLDLRFENQVVVR